MSNQLPFEGDIPAYIHSSGRFLAFITNGQNHVVYGNPAFFTTYGVAANGILNNPLHDTFFIQQGTQKLTEARAKITGETQQPQEIETHAFVNHNFVCVRWEISPYLYNGQMHFLHIGENVTELRIAHHDKLFKKRMLNSVSQAIIATDIDGNITYWNAFAEKLYGWQKEEVMGKNVIEITAANPTKWMAEEIMTSLRKGESWQGEFIVKNKSGHEFPVFVSDSPVFDDNGILTGIIGTSFDLSRQKTTEGLLEEQKRRLAMLNLIAEKTVNAIVMSNPEGNIEWVNDGFSRIFGYRPEEVLGKRPGELLRGKDSDPNAVKIINRAIANKEHYDVEILNYRKNGEPCWLRVQGQPLFDDKGTLMGILDIASDITEKKSQEDQLVFQAHLLDSIMQAVVVTNLEGKITYWNHFAEQLYGWTKEEALGQNILLLTPPETKQEEAAKIMEQLYRGEVWEGEFTVKRKDGSTFPAFVVDSPVYDPLGNFAGIMGVSFDISERKRADEERKKSYTILLKQYKKLKQFAHINAHDLRAPLTNILSIANLVYHEAEMLPLQELKSYIRGLDNSAKQMDGVIRKLNSVLHGYQMDMDKEFFGYIASEIKKHVVLIDDDPVQNLINKKIITNNHPNYEIITYTQAEKALKDILAKKITPDVVFLDLNMPFMDGWDFLEALKEVQIDFEVQILTSSIDQNDFEKARLNPKVSGITSKPLQKDLLEAML